MADISYTQTATIRRSHIATVQGKGEAGNPKVLAATVELAATTTTPTIKLGRVPSNARVSMLSRVYWDDLATTGSPTLDIGFASVNANITSDDDALNDGLALTTATKDEPLIKDFANVGKRAWEYVNGQTTDPGGELDLYASLKDAATTTTGTISVEMLYTID